MYKVRFPIHLLAIVALLAMLVPIAPVAGASEVFLTSATVQYLGHTNNPDGTSTWTYYVCSVGAHDISHLVFEIDPCIPKSAFLAGSDGVVDAVWIDLDPTTGVRGIKYDSGYSTGECRTVWFKLQGWYNEAPMIVAVKDKNVSDVSTIGPDCGAEAVTVASFTATPKLGGGILVTWETASEVDNQGFKLYRGLSDNFGDAVLLAPPFPPSMGSYEYLDGEAEPGTLYYYWLEDMPTSGGAELFGPVSARQSLEGTVILNGDGRAYNKWTTFTVDLDGGERSSDISNVYLLINDTPELAGGVAVKCDLVKKRVFLYQQANGKWLPVKGLKIGKGEQANNLAILRGKGCSVDETTLSVTWELKFKKRFRGGPYNVYAMAEYAGGSRSGWHLAGTWTVQ